jgi:hypothetical protein
MVIADIEIAKPIFAAIYEQVAFYIVWVAASFYK